MRTWGSRGVLPHLAAVEFNFGGYQAKLGTAATRTLFLIKSQIVVSALHLFIDFCSYIIT